MKCKMQIFAARYERLLGDSEGRDDQSIICNCRKFNLLLTFLFCRAATDSLSLIRLGETVPRQEESSPALIHFEKSSKSEAGEEDVQ